MLAVILIAGEMPQSLPALRSLLYNFCGQPLQDNLTGIEIQDWVYDFIIITAWV